MSSETENHTGETGFRRSKFANSAKRNEAALEILRKAFEANTSTPTLATYESDLLDALLGGLKKEPPSASQAAEAALTILAMSLAEERQLDIMTQGSPDLKHRPGEQGTGRLPGDRTLGDKIPVVLLDPRNIPATRGAFQSSSYRSGYAAGQVRDPSLGKFIAWYIQDGRSIEELQRFAGALISAFKKCEVILPFLPEIAAARLTFVNFKMFRERLLRRASGGAYEQYLLAGLLDQEVVALGQGYRVVSKNVIANDASTGSGGDIEVRHGQALVKAYEVTANKWHTKLGQLDSSVGVGLDEVTIVAKDTAAEATGQILYDKLTRENDRLGVDTSVLDLGNLMDVVASRLTRFARRDAIHYVYRSLSRWHRRSPVLAQWLVDDLRELELLIEGTTAQLNVGPIQNVEDVISKFKEILGDIGIGEAPKVAERLRELADSLDKEAV